jgi:uncharacterized protein
MVGILRKPRACRQFAGRAYTLDAVRMFQVILALMLALDVAWWAYAHRLLRPLRRRAMWRLLLALFMGVQIFLLLWTVLAHRFGAGGIDAMPRVLISATYLWHLIALPAVLLAWLLTGTLTMPWRLARWLRREKLEDPRHHVTASETVAAAADLTLEPETCVSPSRRQFLGAAFAAAPPVLTAATVGYSSFSLSRFRIRDIDVAVPELPIDLDGLTIAHVSDTHVGRFTNGPQLRRIVDATNNLRADVVLMTGDLINSSLADLPASIDAMKRVDARHGVYFCEGNHDLFDGANDFERLVKSAGLPLLVNESRTLRVRGHPLQLLGLRWGVAGAARSGGGDDVIAANMPALLAQREPDAFPILLAHHPHAFDVAAEVGIPLTLSGHTHGGQLMLTDSIGFGRVYRYWSGLYRKGPSSLVVSNGIGNWFPLRVNAPAELVKVTLRRA